MIVLARPDALPDKPNLLSTAMECDLAVNPDLQCWEIREEKSGTVRGLLTKDGGFWRLILRGAQAYTFDVLSFLNLLGWETLETDTCLPLGGIKILPAFFCPKPIAWSLPPEISVSFHTQTEEGHSEWEFARLQSQAGVFPEQQIPAYLSSLSMKIRRGTAESYLFHFGGRVVAGANLCAIGQKRAIISGVAVLPEYRGRGLGKLAVSFAAHQAFRKGKVPILCCEQPLKDFYQSMGFELRDCILCYQAEK